MSRVGPLLVASWMALVFWGCGETPSDATLTSASAPNASMPSASVPSATSPRPELDGFVVWESNRGGKWRLWLRDLADGSEPRQVTQDDGATAHCCAHISPDGRSVAYLRLPRGDEKYPLDGASGPLHLLDLETGEDRRLLDEARTYFEHRAVVWKSVDELIFIGPEGRTRSLDILTGEQKILLDEARAEHGWLINRTLTHATTGQPTFSPYRAEQKRVETTRTPGGCQPYFSFDGRFGFWIAGAGGPIRRIDLATRQSFDILGKSDPRLPPGQGYLYFPMLSHDSRLLAFGASRDQHDHQTSDYEIFVGATDPRTLELRADPVRITQNPATDRYPDVFSTPLALGWHVGEVPFRLELESPDGNEAWAWNAGDGSPPETGARWAKTFDRPGLYDLEASLGERSLAGRVEVSPARPPRLEDVELRGGNRVILHFDEEIEAGEAAAELESGSEVSSVVPGSDQRSLEIELAAELTRRDLLLFRGVRDRAQRPNLLPETAVDLAPPTWPSRREGLVFLWEADDRGNRVWDPGSEEEVTCLLEPSGRAWLDRYFRGVLAGGRLRADDASARRLLRGCRATNELSLEITLTAAGESAEPETIVAFGAPGDRSFVLQQQGRELYFVLFTVKNLPPGESRPRPRVGTLEPGKPHHLSITYTPGQLRAYLDGRETLSTDTVRSGFLHWRRRPLVFGGEVGGKASWHGTVEGIALYQRALPTEEVAENALRYRRQLAERTVPAPLRVRARLVRRSPTPTLQEISPYRDALALFEYRVEAVLAGTAVEPGVSLRVAHRVLADGETLPVGRRVPGAVVELDLEPFAGHPPLESLYLSDRLDSQVGRLWYSPQVDP